MFVLGSIIWKLCGNGTNAQKLPQVWGEIPKMFGFSPHNGETATFLTTSGKTPNMGDWGWIPDTKLARQHVQKVTTLYNTLPQID